MSVIVRQVPLTTSTQSPDTLLPEIVCVGGCEIRLSPSQVVVFVSLSRPAAKSPTGRSIPAVVDTGFNGSFAVREEHLTEWAGVDKATFPMKGTPLRHARGWYQPRGANVWLHANLLGTREPGDTAIRLSLSDPMMEFLKPEPEAEAITQQAKAEELTDPRPGFPLIGMRLLTRNNLVLLVNAHRQWASIYQVDQASGAPAGNPVPKPSASP